MCDCEKMCQQEHDIDNYHRIPHTFFNAQVYNLHSPTYAW